ncbi:MAG: DEAD/DEAH box helicase family protein [Ignavibacteriae bacterium]|nr:DEAD/DEAH box helicase family protein [Ignavibacteriota bacterium]
MITEADTCRKYVLPKLIEAGWDNEPHSFTEQKSFTDGRIVVLGNRVKRNPPKRADYLLRYTRDFTIAVVEAKAAYRSAGDGMQQAKEYALMLGLKFAYATNGRTIIEFNFISGKERELNAFPSPDDLWKQLCAAERITQDVAEKVLAPCNYQTWKELRYYKEIAINRVVQSILQGKRRVLLTMATGTGKTSVAFQICWKLWNSGWNRSGEHRKPRILYLSDRNILVDDPKAKDFAPFGDALHKIENGKAIKSREIYFSTYQSIAQDERRPGLYKEYKAEFFDLIIVDECHRGSAKDESNWREILEYFHPAYQLGMTATPLRNDNIDTYRYFGNPIYTYSLRQGIEDGFLAPYRVHRVITSYDAAGWRPTRGELDRYGREVPDKEYQTQDFERVVALQSRTQAIARHLTDFMKKTDRFAKTMVFCVDQEHASEMRRELNNLNTDLVQQYPDYVCRVTADEGEIGRGHLSRFQELETVSPVILTTSQLLTTGVDAPTCKNIVIARVVNSMTEFKQIIGRGTRVRDDYGKFYFNIIDFTGSATRLFADTEFDGQPAAIEEVNIDKEGSVIVDVIDGETLPQYDEPVIVETLPPEEAERNLRKFYVDGGHVEIVADLVYEIDSNGKQLKVMKYTEYAAERIRTLYPNSAELRKQWANPNHRSEIIAMLEERGIDFDDLKTTAKQPDADPFDLLCHLAFNAPLRTHRERADRVKKDQREFFEKYGQDAKAILEALLDKYAEHGVAQFVIPDVLKVPPISEYGNVMEITNKFGGVEKLREAVSELQTLLYAA